MKFFLPRNAFVLFIVCTTFIDLCFASTSSSNRLPKSYNGLLSDFLQINYFHNLSITPLCNQQLHLIQNGLNVKDVWAIKLLDASGHVGAGFVWGNNYWLGSKKACERVEEPTRIVLSHDLTKNHIENLTEIASPFPVGYKLIWAKHQSQWQLDINTFDKTIVHLGLCLPRTCNDEDVSLITDTMLNNRSFGDRYFFDESFLVIQSKSLKLRDNFFRTIIVNVFLCFLASNLILVIVGTIYTHTKANQHAAKKCNSHQMDVNTINNNINCIAENENNNNNSIDNRAVHVDRPVRGTENSEKKLRVHQKHSSFVDRFFSCFCLSKNSAIITTNSLGTESIQVIHGMRALGMIWIIGGHLFFYGPAAIENLHMIFAYAESWYLQPIFAVAMAVDTYFVISGTVLAYLFFQTEKKQKKENPILKFVSSVLNRYLRLTPPFLVAIALTGFVSIYLRDTSQYWMIEHNDINCQSYWWRNLLYIQNMYTIDDMCMSWSWYLAVDFQCFCLTSFLLVIYTKQPKLAVSIFVSVFLASSIFTAYLGYALSYSLSLDVQYKTIDYLYTPTYTRIGAYFIGVYVGWYLSHYERKLDIQKKYLICGWIVGPLLLILMIFGPTKKDFSTAVAVIYTGFGKTAWSLGIAWFIIACATGRGGIVNSILSAKCLLPYSRMTYTAYLINPLCIMFVVMSCEAPIHLDFLSLLLNSLGFQLIVYTLAYVFMLLFENPFIRLGKLLQGK